MKIINQKENKLFNRKEITAELEADVTPSHEQAKELISKEFKTTPQNIRIKKIIGKFGSKTFTISANIYNSEEEKNKVEVFSKKEAEREKTPEPEKPQEEQKAQEEVKEESSELKQEQAASAEIAKEEAVEDKTQEQIEKVKQEGIKEEGKDENENQNN